MNDPKPFDAKSRDGDPGALSPDLQAEIARLLEPDRRVAFVLLFGSRARGTGGPRSDLDLAVGLAPGAGGNRLQLRLELGARLSSLGLEVDLVLADDAPPALAYRIARDGAPLLCRDGQRLTRFKARAYGRYFDWQRFVAPHTAALRRRLEEDTYGR